MALVCIPLKQVERLKAGVASGDISIDKLYDMSSKERRDLFAKYSDENLGKFINTNLEKAMVSKQQDAITKWAKATFTPSEKSAPAYKTVLDKINSLDDLGVLNPESERAFLEDLVSDKLGINVSPDEVRAISKRAKKIDEAQEALGTELGSPTKMKENLDYFSAKKDMDDYLQGLNPAPKVRILTGTIGRAMMLFSVKSPLLNIGSNIEIGLAEGIGRRVANKGLKGANNDLAKQYVRMVHEVYQKTGYDLSRMTSLADTGASGGRVLDDTVHSQGKGVVRKVGRVIEDVVFKQFMGAPDAVFGALHFADSVNLTALKLAKGDSGRATKMMEDALRLKPITEEGELLRAQGILDAQVATWTNKSWASDASLGIRKVLNNLAPDLRLGDWAEPFLKTPANVISTGLDYAGGGAVKAVIDTVKYVRAGELKDPRYVQKITRNLIRAGLGLTGAVIIAANLDDDSFVGAYDPKRSQIEALKNSKENSIKIGDKWVSTDWFGPLAIPINSILYARKYGNGDPKEIAAQYVVGAASTALNLPGVGDTADFVAKQKQKEGQSGAERVGDAGNYVVSSLFSRLVPSFVSDIAKATDSKERKADSGNIKQSIQSKIPGARTGLPAKRNIFGEEIKTENPATTILFGSRVKTDKSNKITKEIQRVNEATGKGVSFSDWQKPTTKTLLEFKQKVGTKKYDEATTKYGQELKRRLDKAVSSGDYKNLDDTDKLKVLNDADAQAAKTILAQYNFKPSKSESSAGLLKRFR